MKSRQKFLRILVVLPCFIAASTALLSAQTGKSAGRIFAQKLVEDTLAAHPELAGLELAGAHPHKKQCVTIAASENKGIGEKCDKDELTARKINKPFVEKEVEDGKQVYDVTIPIHDLNGKIIATAGITFKPAPGQLAAEVEKGAQQIAKELEAKLGSQEKLFEPAE